MEKKPVVQKNEVPTKGTKQAEEKPPIEPMKRPEGVTELQGEPQDEMDRRLGTIGPRDTMENEIARTEREGKEAAEARRQAWERENDERAGGVLPGMGEHVAKQAEGAAKVKGEELTNEINTPRSVDEAAARMEIHSPLFRGTAASPQNEMFKPGGEPVKSMEKPTVTSQSDAEWAKDFEKEMGKPPTKRDWEVHEETYDVT